MTIRLSKKESAVALDQAISHIELSIMGDQHNVSGPFFGTPEGETVREDIVTATLLVEALKALREKYIE